MTATTRRPRNLLPILGALAALTLVGVVASSATPTASDHPRHTRSGDRAAGRFGHGEAISRFLVLDAAQSATVADLVGKLRTEVSPLRGTHRALRSQLLAELGASKPDALRIGKLMIQARASRGDMRSALSRFDQDLRALLRPEQLARYQEWKQKHPRLLSGERGRGRRGEQRGPSGSPDGPGPDDRPL